MSTFRLCVDLNVWLAASIARQNGIEDGASRQIVRAVQDGRAAVGPLQLVVSHTMLSRLHLVLLRRGASLDRASDFVELVRTMALLGPAAEPPHIVLGGGVYPTLDARMRERDPYDPQAVSASIDPEDGRVLDAAVAGRADVLVTWNFRDFASGADDVLVPGRVHLKRTAAHAFVLARPPETARWLRTGEPPPGVDRRRSNPDQ